MLLLFAYKLYFHYKFARFNKFPIVLAKYKEMQGGCASSKHDSQLHLISDVKILVFLVIDPTFRRCRFFDVL